MTIQLSDDLQGFVHDQVRAGRYGSEDEVIRDALNRLRSEVQVGGTGGGSLGLMHDAADELDEVVEHAMKAREGRGHRTT